MAVIGVDFDGTICEHTYPHIGKPIDRSIEILKKLQNKGHKLILWTVRGGEQLQNAVEFCSKNGIFFWGINENPEQYNEIPPDTWESIYEKPTTFEWSCKAYMNILIDDVALGCPCDIINGRKAVNWTKVEEYLIEIEYL